MNEMRYLNVAYGGSSCRILLLLSCIVVWDVYNPQKKLKKAKKDLTNAQKCDMI